VAYYLPAYLLGIYLSSKSASVKKYSSFSIVGLLVLLGIWVVFGGQFNQNTRLDLLFQLSMITVLFGVFFRYLNFRQNILNMLARLSFYIFFCHGYVLFVLRNIGARFEDSINPVLLASLYCLSVFIILIIVYVVLVMLFGNRTRYLVGARHEA